MKTFLGVSEENIQNVCTFSASLNLASNLAHTLFIEFKASRGH